MSVRSLFQWSNYNIVKHVNQLFVIATKSMADELDVLLSPTKLLASYLTTYHAFFCMNIFFI